MHFPQNLNRRRWILAAALAPWSADMVRADDRVIKVLVGFPAGGTMDLIARLLAEKLKNTLGQNVIVDNRPGAQARIAAQGLKSAAPDGQTIMVAPGASVFLFPHAFRRLGYDPLSDFTAVSQLASWDLMLAVPADAGVKDFPQFLNWAKTHPDRAFYGSSSAGSLQHFMGVALAKRTGVSLEHVSFKGGQEAVLAMLGGHIPAVIMDAGELMPLVQAKKIRVLATFGAYQDLRLPQTPTIRQLGYGELETSGWAALYGPAGMPAATVAKINAAVVKAMAEPDLREKLLERGVEAKSSSPKQLDDLGRRDFNAWGDVVKVSGFVAD